MPVELVLGTANFGNAYGIGASKMKEISVDKVMAQRILAKASELQISEIDTASTYGAAEEWLANFVRHNNILINTKIPWAGFGESSIYKAHLNRITSTFAAKNIGSIAWHNWEYSHNDNHNFSKLHSAIDPNETIKFGVTTYGSKNTVAAIKTTSFKTLQIEFNLLNQSALNAFLTQKTGVLPDLYLRSVFLQGILTGGGGVLADNRRELSAFLLRAQSLANEWQLPIEEMAVRAVLGRVSDARVVVGVESDVQLEQIQTFMDKGALPDEMNKQIIELDTFENPAVDPRRWHE